MRNATWVLLLLPLALLVVAIQSTLVRQVHLAGGQPDLILVAVILLTMAGGRETALLPAVILAVVFDAIAGFPLGASILPLLSVVLLAGLGERRLFGARLGWPIVVTAAATVLASSILLLEARFFGWQIDWSQSMLRVVAPSAILNSVLVLILYYPMEYLRQSRSPRLD
ncbi:MAG: rod shape-determining protein MreD [Caldilineales bacterium]|nr:rod shape-determining protein MreD [Caldilineales bacterium]